MEGTQVGTSSGHRQGQSLIWLPIFLVIPLAFVLIVAQLTRAAGPQWLAYNSDGPYQYLFNSLLVAETGRPVMYQHPGTTLMLYGAAILRLSGHGSGSDLNHAVIKDPESFLKVLHWSVLIGSGALAWLVPWFVGSRIKSYPQTLFLQLPLLCFATLLFYSIFFIAEPMLVGLAIADVALVLWLVHQAETAAQDNRVVALAGVLCGIGIVTKLTFFPILLITCLCLRGWKKRGLFFLLFIGTAVVALIPIYQELPKLFGWFFGILTHSRPYGTGSVGLPSSEEYFKSISNLYTTDPLVVWMPILTTAATILVLVFPSAKTAFQPNRFRWPICCVLVCQAIGYLIIAKHPFNYYLIPLFLSTGLNVALLYRILTQKGAPKPLAWLIVGIGIISLCTFGYQTVAAQTRQIYTGLKSNRQAQLALYRRALCETKDGPRADYYRCPSPEFALCLGNENVANYFSRVLAERYPNAYFFSIFTGKFHTFDKTIEPAAMAEKHSRIYFFGTLITPPYDHFPPFDPSSFETLDSGAGCYLQQWKRP